jgi:TPR repeat protein
MPNSNPETQPTKKIKAMIQLANIAEHGLEGKVDQPRALKYHRKLAKLGIRYSMFFMAEAYAIGEGVSQNEKKATKWMDRAISSPRTSQ